MNNFNAFGYNPMYQQQPIQQPIQQPTQQTPIQSYVNGSQLYYINSKEEAEKWVVGQGQTVYLFDNANNIFYIKSVAKNGLPQPLEAFAYQKVEEEPKVAESVEYATVDQLEALSKKIESEIKKLKPIKKGVKKDE